VQPLQFFRGLLNDARCAPHLPFEAEELFTIERPAVVHLQVHQVGGDFQYSQRLTKIVQNISEERFRFVVLC
jgi:hypothetical protein